MSQIEPIVWWLPSQDWVLFPFFCTHHAPLLRSSRIDCCLVPLVFFRFFGPCRTLLPRLPPTAIPVFQDLVSSSFCRSDMSLYPIGDYGPALSWIDILAPDPVRSSVTHDCAKANCSRSLVT